MLHVSVSVRMRRTPSLCHKRMRAETSGAHRGAPQNTVQNRILVLQRQWRLRHHEGRVSGAILGNEGHPSHAVAWCAAERDEATPCSFVPAGRVHEHLRASFEPANLWRLERMI